MNLDYTMWVIFGTLVFAALAVDLGICQRKAHVVRPKEALAWSLVWVVLALLFNAGVWWAKGSVAAGEFLAGYLVEKSLSVDNLFVFLVIFSWFSVPKEYEARILLWGVMGALVLRAIFVFAGAALLDRFHWMIYVFGGLLILTGIKMLVKKDGEGGPERNPLVRFLRRVLPVTPAYDGERFFTRVEGRRFVTPLFLTLVVVEFTDVVFAVDSIPAVFAVTRDPFIVLTSNVFALLGMRSLYFLLADANGLFRFLKFGLVLILWFVGAKMLLAGVVKIPISLSLAVVGGILAGSIALSILLRPRISCSPEAKARL